MEFVELSETIPITIHELNLINYIRSFGYGSIEVTIQDSQPIIVKKAIQSTKL